MHNSRKSINIIRGELNAIVPEKVDEPLPPQPSIVPPTLGRKHYAKKIIKGVLRPKDGAQYWAEFREQYIMKSPKKLFESIHFTHHDNVTVSIIVPVFNKFNLTCECLYSIFTNVPKSIKYEVIVVDNNSTDRSHLLDNVPGLVYIRNKENLGFVDGCNAGAKNARGDFLAFLNNDAMVQPEWLESLLDSIQTLPDAGLIGSKIIYPDGRLQEAGGVIFKDGSGNNYGKNDHPDRYQYNYVRDVDYCSGASIIIRKELFDSFGGFDKLYAPAYYEDTDLAFKVRQAGLRVIYQPESIIYHIEGATAGTSTAGGFKKYQAINHEKFLKRWKKTLEKNHYTTGELHIARDRSADKLALIIDENIPTPDQDSGSVRMYRIIQSLQELGYKVTFFPNHTGKRPKYMRPLQQMGVEVVYGELRAEDFIKEYGGNYNLVMLSRPRIGSYYLDICQAYCTKAKIIYDTVDLHYLRLNRQAEFTDSPEEKAYLLDMAGKHEILEKFLMSEVDETLVVSDAEVKLLEQENIENVSIVSNIHDINEEAYDIGFEKRKDLLFVGGFAHMPNIDAIKWFVNDIFPEVVKKDPEIKLHIVGSKMPDELRHDLEKHPNVIVDGFVEDLEPLLKSSRIFVAPLRYGAGVKGKIGQAVEYGIPVVSTSIGSEGMYLVDKKSCIEANSETDFAKSIIELYTDYKLWSTIQQNSREVIDAHFSKSSAKKALRTILF